jgi:hypothetical protein
MLFRIPIFCLLMPFQVLVTAMLSAFEEALSRGLTEIEDRLEASIDLLSETMDKVCGRIEDQLHGLGADLDKLIEAAKECKQQVQSPFLPFFLFLLGQIHLFLRPILMPACAPTIVAVVCKSGAVGITSLACCPLSVASRHC